MIKKIWYLLSKYVLVLLPFNLHTNILFRINNKRLGFKYYKLNIDHPQTFSEKINYIKKYNRNKNAVRAADKVSVREYVSDKIGPQYLIKKLGVYKNANEINFESLPNQFVLKANHGSGWNVICLDKSKLNIKKCIKQLNKWLKQNAYYSSREWHYNEIVPRIIGEEFLEFNAIDYKLFCFNGKTTFIQIDVDRYTKHKRIFYSTDWIKQNFGIIYPLHNEEFAKPSNLNEMITLANKLAEDFIFARIDFYNKNGKVFFGEITLHPGGGVAPFDSFESDLYLGSLLNLNL